MNAKRKLTLNRETVRVLSSKEMHGVAGGALPISIMTGCCNSTAIQTCTECVANRAGVRALPVKLF